MVRVVLFQRQTCQVSDCFALNASLDQGAQDRASDSHEFFPLGIKHTLLIPYVNFNIAPAKLLSNRKVVFQASIFQGGAAKLPVRVGDRWSLF